jgi:hypothetical protein
VKPLLACGMIVLAVAAAPAAEKAKKKPEPPTAEKLKQLVTFNFQDAAVTDALVFLRDRHRLTMVIGPGLRKADLRLTLKLKEVECHAALLWIARTVGTNCSIVNDVVCVGSRSFIKKCKKTPVPAGKEGELPHTLIRKVDYNFLATPLADVIALLRRDHKLNIVALGGNPKKEAVTLRVYACPLGVTLKYVGLTIGRRVKAQGGVILFNIPAKPKGN